MTGRVIGTKKLVFVNDDELENVETAVRALRGVFEVRPGITGVAQVNEVDMSTPRKLARYDQIMVRRMSLTLYFKMIAAPAVGKGRGDRVRTALA